MMRFRYRAKNDRGDVVGGIVRADNVLSAEKILRDNNLITVDIFPESGDVSSLLSFFRKRVSLKEKAIFASQLSTMISAGLPLPKAMNILAAQTDNQFLKSIFYNVNRDLEEGLSFSSSLAKYPLVFDELFVNVVRSGESTGNLEKVLVSLSTKLDNENRISSKLLTALIYPAFIIVALIAVAWLLMVKIVPQIESVFKEANTSLPWATKALIATSHFIALFWWVIIIIVIAIIAAVRYYVSTDQGREFYARVQLRTPGIRRVATAIYMSRFCRSMEMLFESGVPLLEAIHTTANIMVNDYYNASLNRIAKEVQKGISFSVELSKDPLFPALVSQMVAVGEQTGKTAEVMDKLASFYELEADNELAGAYSLVEPMAMVLVGIGVAILVFAILIPIYQVAQLQ